MPDLIHITRVVGRPIPLRGNDIDTDRIIPARYMKAVTFEGLGQYVFYDARFDTEGHSTGHVMDDPRFEAKGPRIAIVNKNFGCGSSREHAPQAIARWGIRAVVGESFAEIFLGNAVAIGLPCVRVTKADLGRLRQAIEASDPSAEFVVDLGDRTVTGPGIAFAVHLPDTARDALLSGQWDATAVLLDHEEDVARVAAALPYLNGFRN